MSQRVETEICQLFADAERRHQCVVPASPRERQALERRCALGWCQRVFPSCYARTAYRDQLKPPARTRHIVRTLAQLRPSWVLCGPTAALMHGLPVSYRELNAIHLAVAPSSHTRSTNLLVRHTPESTQSVIRDGVLVTPLEQTVIDCARWLDFSHPLALADAALHQGLCTLDDLNACACNYGAHRHGATNALDVLRFADARSESGGESICRGIMIEENFMIPELQYPVENPLEPGRCFYADYAWLLATVLMLGEFDGLIKYTDPTMLRNGSLEATVRAERTRESLLTIHGHPVIRFTYDDLCDRQLFVAKLGAFGVPRMSTPWLRSAGR